MPALRQRSLSASIALAVSAITDVCWFSPGSDRSLGW